MAERERLDKLLSRLGYCSRKGVGAMLREERLLSKSGLKLRFDTKVTHEDILLDGKGLDEEWLFLALHKPAGYVCTISGDEGATVFELVPNRFACRNPPLSTVGRLDKESSGLLLLTDDGDLIHRFTSPNKEVGKKYYVKLAKPLAGNEKELFESGSFVLNDAESVREHKGYEQLKPVEMQLISEQEAYLTLFQGRYRQVRRMFRAVLNEVVELHRVSIGALQLDQLKVGEYRHLTREEVNSIIPS